MRQGVREKALFVATCVCYLGAFFCLLTFRRAPKGFGALARRLRARWARRTRKLKGLYPDSGHCYLVKVPPELTSDSEGRSRVVVFEDGVPLPQPHASHDDIRKHGRGAYSHWNGEIYLSASDNSDPRTNGRRYAFAELPDAA
jgi:hypothetical protein